MSQMQIGLPPQDTQQSGNLDALLAAAEARLAADARLRRNTRIVELSLVGFVAALWLISTWADVLHVYIPVPEHRWNEYYSLLEVGLVLAVLFALVREAIFRIRAGHEAAELEFLRAKKRSLENLPTAGLRSESANYFDALVRINVENLAGYYALVKTHTDKSFAAAISMGIAGFVLLVLGLILGFGAVSNKMPYISAGAGVVTEFVASIFFYLYNRTIQQMKGYHDSLLDVQNVLLALKLVDDTEPSADRVKMIGQMLGYLLTKRPAAVLAEAPLPKADVPSLAAVHNGHGMS